MIGMACLCGLGLIDTAVGLYYVYLSCRDSSLVGVKALHIIAHIANAIQTT